MILTCENYYNAAVIEIKRLQAVPLRCTASPLPVGNVRGREWENEFTLVCTAVNSAL